MTIEEELVISQLYEKFNAPNFQISKFHFETSMLCMKSGSRFPDDVLTCLMWAFNRKMTAFFATLDSFEQLGPQDQLTLLGNINITTSLLQVGFSATPMRPLSEWAKACFSKAESLPKKLNFELNQVKPPAPWYKSKGEAQKAEMFFNDVIRLGMDHKTFMLTILCAFFKSTSGCHIEEANQVQKTGDKFSRLLLRHLCTRMGRHYVEHLYHLHLNVINHVGKLPELKVPSE